MFLLNVSVSYYLPGITPRTWTSWSGHKCVCSIHSTSSLHLFIQLWYLSVSCDDNISTQWIWQHHQWSMWPMSAVFHCINDY